MMKWEPSAYGDVRNLKFISDLLWKPDIVVFNKYVHELFFTVFYGFQTFVKF